MNPKPEDVGIKNSFRFIGEVISKSCNPYKTDNGMNVCMFLLSISNRGTNTIIPIFAIKGKAELASQFCINGNIVAVNGYITSKEIPNGDTTQLRVMFLATDILLLGKSKKRNIDERKFSDLIGLYSLEEYV